MKQSSWAIKTEWQSAFEQQLMSTSERAWQQALAMNDQGFVADDVASFLTHPSQDTMVLVWVNGEFQASFSHILNESVFVESIEKHPQYPLLFDEYFAHIQTKAPSVAAMLPLLAAREGSWVRLNAQVKKVVFHHIVTTERAFGLPIWLECAENGCYEFEQYTTLMPGVDAHVAQFMHLKLGHDAKVKHAFKSALPSESQAFTSFVVDQEASSAYDYYTASIGSGSQTTSVHVNQNQANAQVKLEGILMGQQSASHQESWFVNHAAKHGQSDMHFRAIMGDASNAMWTGHAHVGEQVPHCTITQMCRQLMTSDHARMHAKPTLTIYCDEVACTHGCTSGQLDEEALFYACSRGLPVAEAQALLMSAFINEMISHWTSTLLLESLSQVMAPTNETKESIA